MNNDLCDRLKADNETRDAGGAGYATPEIINWITRVTQLDNYYEK
jgi:hypothetical protein